MRFRSLGRLVFAALMACATPSIAQAPQASGATPPISREAAGARADALIARMTLEEKAGQISQQFVFGNAAPFETKVRDGSVGSLLFLRDPVVINRLQRVAVEESRLGIPLLFGFDVVHGLRTIFPVPLAMAATWDPELVEQSQAVAAREARASGIHWTFAPMLDLTRDPRWGRIVEGPGEDPWLASVLAAAQVRGFQGEAVGTPGRVIAGPKHFIGYGASEGGRDYDSAYVSDVQLHNLYVPPFAAAIEAGAGNVMSAYMELNDLPAVANRPLLDDLLRGELGFEGFVVSDANAVRSLLPQGLVATAADAAIRSLEAGNDMEMSLGNGAYGQLAAAVREGRLDEQTLDQSVRRVLIAKIQMGLFEQPYVDAGQTEAILSDPEHRRLARTAAGRSLVLLENRGSLLPLDRTAYGRVAVIGPMADSAIDTLGPWSFGEKLDETVTLYQGVRAELGGLATVETAPGVQPRRGTRSMFAAFRAPPAAWSADETVQQFDRALDLARTSDLIVLAIGEDFYMSGEQASRASLALAGEQQRLIDAVTDLGKPVVLVLINGRPLDIRRAITQVPAILEAWHPGTEGGAAVADVLFGDVNPGGRLPITWPKDVGQIPIYYSHNATKDPTGAASRYWDLDSAPLYPFGYGLSYTTFAYSELTVDRATIAPGQSIVVSVVVTNTGDRAGDDTAQLYIRQRTGSSTRPVRELKGFQRVALAVGESRKLTFTLGEKELRYWSAGARDWIVDPAAFDVWVGSDSTAQLATQFETIRPQ